MKTLTDQLSQYAAYHRDPRNLMTHLVGTPMIVVAVTTLLGRPSVALGPVALSPASVVAVAVAIYYLRLDIHLGAVMTLLLAIAVALGQWFAGMTTRGLAGRRHRAVRRRLGVPVRRASLRRTQARLRGRRRGPAHRPAVRHHRGRLHARMAAAVAAGDRGPHGADAAPCAAGHDGVRGRTPLTAEVQAAWMAVIRLLREASRPLACMSLRWSLLAGGCAVEPT